METIKTKTKGLLLVNLGSPAAPTPAAVREFLAAFLGDSNVVTMPRAIWQPILRGMVLPHRPAKSAAAYQRIWTEAGSTLTVNTQRLTRQVQACLPDWDVRMAMTYLEPAVETTLREMQA